ncbi:Plant intracellular Ras-group-related LRR protein 6 [Ranunculus cassubicifolius]
MVDEPQPLFRMEIKKKEKNRRSSAVTEVEEKLRVVDLSGLSMNSLPTSSLNLGTICKLDLSNNNLENIPESMMARLLNVVVLDVHSNQLKTLPNSLGCLSKLKIFNISGNLLESLPKTIENCRCLEELNANFNKLQKLPDTIGFELVNLVKLSVNSNKLDCLPYSTSHLTNLRILDARLNCLRSLPEGLENLINLEVLNISQNFQYLTTLPDSLGFLMSLKELDISYNKISVLPNSIGWLKNLEKLSVEGNPLISPPMDVMEQSLNAVKEYLLGRMNGTTKGPVKKTWLKRIVKWGTFNGHDRKQKQVDKDGFTMPEYRSLDGLATPGYMGIFSPRRVFSPRRY